MSFTLWTVNFFSDGVWFPYARTYFSANEPYSNQRSGIITRGDKIEVYFGHGSNFGTLCGNHIIERKNS